MIFLYLIVLGQISTIYYIYNLTGYLIQQFPHEWVSIRSPEYVKIFVHSDQTGLGQLCEYVFNKTRLIGNEKVFLVILACPWL